MESSRYSIRIWFFVGSLLFIYGAIIFVTGIIELAHPAGNVALAHLHPAIWWGLLLLGIGGFYCVRYRPGRQ